MEEIWRDVEGYEGLYQVSNFGNVKSLARVVKWKNTKRTIKEKLLKLGFDFRGYLVVGLCKEGKLKTKRIHVLVAIAFLNHTPDGTQKIVVDHIDNNKLNNNLENLQLTSNRHNCSKDKKGTSKYTGVSWHKASKKWASQIRINGKVKHIGYFSNEIDASKAYQSKLESLIK